jgi:hypothetical protein
LSRIEKEIRATIGADADRVKAIGLSATPFELHSLQRVWKVFQRLGPTYRGFNEFGGKPIDPSVRIQPPDSLSVRDAAAQFKIPFLQKGMRPRIRAAPTSNAGPKKSATPGHGSSTARIA